MVLPQLIIQNKRQELAGFLEFKGGLENKRSFFPFFFLTIQKVNLTEQRY